MRALIALIAGLIAACASGSGVATSRPPSCTFTNPIASGADPWVVKRGGAYHYARAAGRSIHVNSARTLTGAIASGSPVWTAPDTGWNRSNVWAPELVFLDGRWYIYYAAGRSGPPFIHQRSGVLESVGDDPRGPYVDRGMLATGDDLSPGAEPVWAIDVTVGRIGGGLYAIWSGWEANAATDRTPQHLYIARMSNPYTIASPRVRLSSPTEPWERGTALDLQEGPQLLQRDGVTLIVYSTRESWLEHYKLGQLRLTSPTADPLRPSSWTKSGPVFAAAPGVYGVGHASFTTSPDDREHWIVYHAKVSTTPGWERVVRMQRFTWRRDGSPDFGTPMPADIAIERPSGECR